MLAGGQARLDYFKKVVQRPDTSKTDLEMDFSAWVPYLQRVPVLCLVQQQTSESGRASGSPCKRTPTSHAKCYVHCCLLPNRLLTTRPITLPCPEPNTAVALPGPFRFGTAELWAALFSFLYLDLLDATGTFYSMANYINKRVPGFIDPVSNTFPRMTAAFCVDGVATWIGALMGIPPLTTYIESATGGCATGCAIGFCARHGGASWKQ